MINSIVVFSSFSMTVAIKCGVQYLRFHIYSPRIALHCCDKAGNKAI